ncbi:MAG: pilus assembly protein PilP, partial [Thiotrichales bacterium]|nr:pilus assembly protein PilP [Thiotrichales bacterium]
MGKTLSHLSRSVALVSALLIAGCGGDGDTTDLQNYVTQVKSQQKGRIEPLPEFTPFETFAYDAVSQKDPFAAWVTERAPEPIITENGEVRQVARPLGVSPDFDRRKELLEQYPIDSLNMLGTLDLDNVLWAIISDPDNIVHRVKVGN